MLRKSRARCKRQEGAVVHHFATVIALKYDHLLPHSGQIFLCWLIASVKAVLTVGPIVRPQEHEAEYMM